MSILRFLWGLLAALGLLLKARARRSRKNLQFLWFQAKIAWYQHGKGWEPQDAKRIAQGKPPRSGVVNDYTATQKTSWDDPELAGEVRLTRESAAVFQETIEKVERGEELDHMDRSVIKGLNSTLKGV